jgi:phage gp16-like protein
MTDRATTIKFIHAGARQLALTDDSRHALQARLTGKQSLTEMTAAELERVAAELRRLGAGKPAGKSRRYRPAAARPQARKIYAMWGALHRVGAVEDGSAKAADSWVLGRCGIASAAFVDDNAVFDRLISALRLWCARVGAEVRDE